MRVTNFFKLVIAIVVSELAGVIGSVFTISAIPTWYAGLVKPALNPPAWVFSPVWTALYALIGISLYLVWKNNWEVKNRFLEVRRKAWNRWSERLWTGDLQKMNAVAIFGVQYILNIAWPYLFFGLHLPSFAFFELCALWFSIVWTVVVFYRISRPAAYLLVPYLVWVSFALYLNYSIWMLN
ncbi:tryptophan-rich sensory protein [Candidatus Azambacteria bacterium]|nr:tryptophan-rich sensory protein [Candidatus Azambacteria bacterium]